ncbi:hypothetical protein ADL03_32145 [Nocardia sp. NRRL S-836]|nr:hypothetical protein ADL03_32145 [Nocardia sp. NRRL S-836]
MRRSTSATSPPPVTPRRTSPSRATSRSANRSGNSATVPRASWPSGPRTTTAATPRRPRSRLPSHRRHRRSCRRPHRRRHVPAVRHGWTTTMTT